MAYANTYLHVVFLGTQWSVNLMIVIYDCTISRQMSSHYDSRVVKYDRKAYRYNTATGQQITSHFEHLV